MYVRAVCGAPPAIPTIDRKMHVCMCVCAHSKPKSNTATACCNR